MSADRGQAFTVEGIAAALLLVGTLVFALQSTGLTALSAGTAGDAAATQQADLARGVLDGAAASDSLSTTLRYWNNSSVGPDGDGSYYGAGPDGYYVAAPPTRFGASLDRQLAAAGYAYNVNVYYEDENGTVAVRRLVEQGTPSDDALRAARTVTLFDDDVLTAPGAAPGAEVPTDATLENATTFYVPDVSAGPVHNVVQVEVVAWRV